MCRNRSHAPELGPAGLAVLVLALAAGTLIAGRAVAAPPASEPSAPAGQRLERVRDIGRAIDACWRRASLPREALGSQITVRFSLRRDGVLLGVPRITYSLLRGDAAAQKLFVGEALAALERCLPLPLSPGLGGAVAGRPLTVRLIHETPPQRA